MDTDTTNTQKPRSVPIGYAFDRWIMGAESEGLRPSSVGNRQTCKRTAVPLFETAGATTTGQITPDVLEEVVVLYTRRRNRSGEEIRASSARSFSIRLKTLCADACARHFLSPDQYAALKLYRCDEDADLTLWSLADILLGAECIHAFWDPVSHPEIAATWSREEAKVLETRAAAWFGLAASIGARRGEMGKLRGSDVDRERRVIRFAAKGTKSRKDRELPLSDRVAALLVDMEAARVALAAARAARPKKRGWKPVGGATIPRTLKPKGDWLFRNCYGEQVDGPSTLRQLQRYFRWGRSQGMALPERFTLHSLRHVAISAALQVSAEHGRQLAGHASVVTTQQIYGHTLAEDVRQTHQQTDVYERAMSSGEASALAPPPEAVPPGRPCALECEDLLRLGMVLRAQFGRQVHEPD